MKTRLSGFKIIVIVAKRSKAFFLHFILKYLKQSLVDDCID